MKHLNGDILNIFLSLFFYLLRFLSLKRKLRLLLASLDNRRTSISYLFCFLQGGAGNSHHILECNIIVLRPFCIKRARFLDIKNMPYQKEQLEQLGQLIGYRMNQEIVKMMPILIFEKTNKQTISLKCLLAFFESISFR